MGITSAVAVQHENHGQQIGGSRGSARRGLRRVRYKTAKFQNWAIPSGGSVVRNMSVTRDGNIAIACSGVNKVGLVELY